MEGWDDVARRGCQAGVLELDPSKDDALFVRILTDWKEEKWARGGYIRHGWDAQVTKQNKEQLPE